MSARAAPMAPLSDAIIIAVARLVGDALSGTREPSHSDIEFQFNRVGLGAGDPKAMGQQAGKAKRVRGVLSWALDNDPQAGGAFVASLISLIQGCGGFRETSPNYPGGEVIQDAVHAFRAEGYVLSLDGDLRSVILDSLEGIALTEALEAYVRRAKRGGLDAALVTGTGKDLLEAVAAHIVHERWSTDATRLNFPTLLGQAFVAVGLATPQDVVEPGEHAQRRLDRALYAAGLAVNHLRNKEGTGHGRPWLPSVSDSEAKTAVEIMGIIAERLLAQLRSQK